jgi:GT2 family glycosyltransferase
MTEEGREHVRIVIVMLTLNQKEKTIKCLQNLSTIDEPEFDVLLWDNGSEDGTAQEVRAAFPEVLVHHHTTNLGVAPGRNAAAALAIEVFDPSHILFLDNDMWLEPAFVSALLAPFEEDERVAQTQAKLLYMNDPKRLNDGGGCKITFWLGRTVPVGCGEIDRGQYDTRRRCVAGGGAMMVRTDVFQELRGFDATYSYLGPDDLDFSLRVSKAGYLVLFVPEAVAYHEVSHTFGGEYDSGYARLKARNWFVFLRRHAPLSQRLAFYLVGMPYIVARLALREGRRGNLEALGGLARGAIDYVSSMKTSGSD